MLEIERISRLSARYTLDDDEGHTGSWARRRFREEMDGDLDGERYELRRERRNRLVLVHSGRVLATADAGKRGRWMISCGDSTYVLARKSRWRSEMELRSGEKTLGSLRKARRGGVLCDLPSEVSPAARAFVAFVVLTLWNRAAAGAEAGAVAATG